MAAPAPGILVGRLDQRPDGAPPIANHLGRDPLGDSHHLPIDHQHPEVAALVLLLDNYPPAVLGR